MPPTSLRILCERRSTLLLAIGQLTLIWAARDGLRQEDVVIEGSDVAAKPNPNHVSPLSVKWSSRRRVSTRQCIARRRSQPREKSLASDRIVIAIAMFDLRKRPSLFSMMFSSALSRACQYALTLWKKLTRFLDYPELALSTNLAEKSMRPVALGRKSWIHIGSPQAEPKVAAILPVVESCRSLKVPAAITFLRFSPGLPISGSGAFQTLPPLPGSPSIHRLQRRGCWREGDFARRRESVLS